jgi:CheY-like chemotaxis protein
MSDLAQTIVVAEDEPLTRMMAVEVLLDAGFSVIETDRAEAALETVAAQAHGVVLLFTDVQMPGAMSGLDLARHVHRTWPEIRLLIASGRVTPKPGDLPAGSHFLAKPYDREAVIEHVRQLVPPHERGLRN